MNEWITKLKDKLNEKPFITPIAIDNDCDYLKSLQKSYDDLKALLEEIDTDKSIIEEIKRYKRIMTKAINDYFRGRTDLSQASIDKLIKELINDHIAAPDNLKRNMAFIPYIGGGLYFFRARCSDEIIDFEKKDILHIPFSQRYKVRTERFGLPGIPCLYLGTSSYVCWLELGRPADHRFNVSALTLPNELRILNLAVSWNKIIFGSIANRYSLSELKTLFQLFLLSIATSFKVKQKNRDFKSEYIISHLITLSCIKFKLDGIAYYSKQLNNDCWASEIGINVALFARYEPGIDLSELCSNLKVTTSCNYFAFKQTNNHLSGSISHAGFGNLISINKDTHCNYADTIFSKFDVFLRRYHIEKFQNSRDRK